MIAARTKATLAAKVRRARTFASRRTCAIRALARCAGGRSAQRLLGSAGLILSRLVLTAQRMDVLRTPHLDRARLGGIRGAGCANLLRTEPWQAPLRLGSEPMRLRPGPECGAGPDRNRRVGRRAAGLSKLCSWSLGVPLPSSPDEGRAPNRG